MKFQPLLDKLASPARRAILSTGVTTLEGLSRMSRDEIAALHGIGKNALQLIEATLEEYGLFLAKGD